MYQIFKLVHLAAVIMFLGNVITGLFWKAHADRTRDVKIIAHMMEGIIRSDRWFTIPGVVVITAAGILAAVQGGLPLLRTGWIFWSIIAFSASGIAFAWKVAPLQREILAMAKAAGDGPLDWTLYKSKSLRWELWGLLATGLPVIAVVMMVIKRPV